jgi:hypothetical protein
LRAAGRFANLPDGTALGYSISGGVNVFSFTDSTTFQVWATGLGTSATSFPTHVHNGTCASGGGTHYEIDPTQPAGQANEIWPTVNIKEDGEGTGYARVNTAIRPDARSVVIHDPATKKKIACADVTIRGAMGQFADLPAGTMAQLDIDGFGMIRGLSSQNAIVVMAFARGLVANTAYPAHVHVDACANGAGGHYQVDPTQPAGEANELWLSLMTDDEGMAFAKTVREGAVPRLDAKAIVIHDPVSHAKLACADLK